MRQLKFYLKRILFIVGVSLITLSCQRKSELAINESITCDLEQISEDGKYFISSSHADKFFQGPDKLTNNFAHSGENAILLKEGASFGLKYILKNTKPDEYYSISVWRKGKNDLGYLAVSDEHDQIFYRSTHTVDSVGSDGWERLTLSFYMPPNFRNVSLKIFVMNKDTGDVYFDDISISRFEARNYPAYDYFNGLNLFVDAQNTLKLEEKRKNAFNTHILKTEDDDYVEGVMFNGEEMYRTSLRLKGDWLDHLLGPKWSLRIKVKDDETWSGMRTFSVQNPKSRDFINEWLMHAVCHERDILATRYGFIPLSFNNMNQGIYAWEEHFEKYLIEHNSRREGPILKLNENALWELTRLRKAYKEDISLPIIQTAEILPFKAKRTTRDEVLFGQYRIAQELYHQYKYALKPASDIFDIDKLGKYFAMIDLFRTYHGITWHNQRFYYNPVLSKLEPIIFDNFSEHGPVQYIDKAILGDFYLNNYLQHDKNIMIANLFMDTAFINSYIKYLQKYSDENFIKGILTRWDAKISFYESLIQSEYEKYHFDSKYLVDNAERIREELPAFMAKVAQFEKPLAMEYLYPNPEYDRTEHHEISTEFVQAYTESSNDSINMIRIENYYTSDILLLGTSKKSKGIRNYYLPEIEVNAIAGRNYGDTVIETKVNSKFLYYMIKGETETYMVPIFSWPKPAKESPLQEMFIAHKDNFRNYFIENPGRILILKSGEYRISEHLIIPRGYKVMIEKGVQMNITNHAAFISYSNVEISGTADDPVVIKSSDGTANGFSVFQAPGHSIVEHTVFDRLNTVNIDGWKLTGAVNFYESDVDFYYSTFQNNLCEDGLNIIRSEFLIDQCKVYNTFADALDVDFGTGIIKNTEFKYLSNDGIDVSGSNVKVYHCTISNSNDKGVSAGENSIVHLENTNVSGSVIGFASKDLSKVFARNCTIEDCNYGITVFKKKPEFGSASLEAYNLIMKNVSTEFLLEQGSRITIDSLELKADIENIADIFYD